MCIIWNLVHIYTRTLACILYILRRPCNIIIVWLFIVYFIHFPKNHSICILTKKGQLIRVSIKYISVYRNCRNILKAHAKWMCVDGCCVQQRNKLTKYLLVQSCTIHLKKNGPNKFKSSTHLIMQMYKVNFNFVASYISLLNAKDSIPMRWDENSALYFPFFSSGLSFWIDVKHINI